jgi:hypothetical protein
MKAGQTKELIVIRSLTESDLGLFSAHRAATRSKQRAININAPVARQLLSEELFGQGGGHIDCFCVFGDLQIHETRYLGKAHKNWRLGGKKIEGDEFAKLDCKDFMLIRSVAGNDGTYPVTITFVGRKIERVIHAGIVAIVEKVLNRSMAVYVEGAPGFADLSRYCPAMEYIDQRAHRPKRQRVPAAPVASVQPDRLLYKAQHKRTIHAPKER